MRHTRGGINYYTTEGYLQETGDPVQRDEPTEPIVAVRHFYMRRLRALPPRRENGCHMGPRGSREPGVHIGGGGLRAARYPRGAAC